jgi:hypothetical protein
MTEIQNEPRFNTSDVKMLNNAKNRNYNSPHACINSFNATTDLLLICLLPVPRKNIFHQSVGNFLCHDELLCILCACSDLHAAWREELRTIYRVFLWNTEVPNDTLAKGTFSTF